MRIKKQPAGRSRSKVTKNRLVTRSGKVVKIHHGLSQKWLSSNNAKKQRKAQRLAGMPKSRFKRALYRLHPKRLYHYWFSRDGLIMALKLTGLGLVAAALLIVGALAYFRKDLPDLNDISGNNLGGSVRYYDRTGQTLLWEDYDAVKRIPVEDANISQFVKDATIAIEDKDFFNHGGFDVRGIMRAGFNNFFGNGSTQGGSTITQQLVKLTQEWSRDRSYTRKVKELILSVELERTYTKQQILVGYLNTAPYGGIEYGVEAASRNYFQKSAKDLTLEEASMLAAIPKSPAYYSPYSADFDKEDFIGRQHYILDQMEQQGRISKEQRDAAKGVDVLATVKPRQPKFLGIKAPWFVLAAKKQFEDTKTAETFKRGGWSITTTLDMGLQTIAEEQVNKGLEQVRRQGGDSAGFVAEDVETGQVVALVGGADFSNQEYGQINYAQTNLPPGSGFKPYDYISLIESGNNVGAGSVLYDVQGPIEGYACTNKALPKQGGNCLQNYDFRYPGPLTLRYALGGSRNVPAVKAMLIAGVDKTIDIAEKMMDPRNGSVNSGYRCFYDEELTKEGPCYASAAIGDGAYLHLDEHVHGYGTLARNGLNIPQTYILKISDASGKTIDEWKPTEGEQVVRPDSAYIVGDILSDPNASYFPAGRKPHRYNNGQGTWNFGMKTGTTNDGKDGWMMGFSAKYAAGVWVGYHSRRVVMRGTMESMTQPIWQGWMQGAHKNLPPKDRPRPESIKVLPAFVVRSHVGIGSVEPSPATDLFPGWYEGSVKTNGQKRTIDTVSNKLATECTPSRAKKEISDADASAFSADTIVGGQAVNTNEKDDIHKCEDVRPSLDNLSISASGLISTTVYKGTHPLSSEAIKGVVNFLAGGAVIGTVNVDSDGQSVSFDSSSQPAGTTITAEVIDSVLYDGASPNSVTTESDDINLSVNNVSGNTFRFTWNNQPAVSYQLCVSNTIVTNYVCEGFASGNTKVVAGTNRKAYVQAGSNQSNTVSFP
jgi:membrane peptidoglycan carboxypeptidase